MKPGIGISQESVLSTCLPPIAVDKERSALGIRNSISPEQLALIQNSRQTLQLGTGQVEPVGAAPNKPLDAKTLSEVTNIDTLESS